MLTILAMFPSTLTILSRVTTALFLQEDDHMGGWDDWFAMTIMMIVFWGGLIGVGILLVRVTSGRHTHLQPDRSALDIARERLARGEISDDEFQRITTALARR